MRIDRSADASWSALVGLSPELRVLLDCAKAVLDEDSSQCCWTVLKQCPCADRLVDAAIAHGMLGHLHRQATSVSAPFAKDSQFVRRLVELQRNATILGLRQSASLLRLLNSLEAAEVAAMPIKGPAWAESLYGDVAMRVCADLDVIVRHDQMEAAREVALENGYVDAAWYNERVVRWHKEGWGHIEMSPTGSNPFLELHWEVFVSIGCRSLHGEDLLARAAPGSLLGREILAPSPIDGLLIDCVHGTKHEWDTVERMLGMAVRVSCTPAEDWERVVAAARRAKCRRRLVIAVEHVCRVFGLEAPAEIHDSLRRDSFARLYLRYLKPVFLENDYERTPQDDLARLATRFIAEDSVLLSLRHAAIRFFTPGPEDWEAYSLPRHLEWLYYPLRPFRLAMKWVRRLLGGPKEGK